MEEARKLTKRTIIPVLKGVTRDEAEQHLETFRRSDISGRVTTRRGTEEEKSMAEMCPYCGDELAPSAATCGRCGMDVGGSGAPATPQTEMCPMCGADVPPLAANCPKCNTEISSAEDDDRVRVETVSCPHCDEPMKKSAHRCSACGRQTAFLVDDSVLAENLKFKLYFIGGIIVFILLLFVFFIWAG